MRLNSSQAITLASDVPTLPEFAYVRLREQILSGELAADAPLRQEKLATSLGLSRLPVREALTRLESEGLVTLRPRRGYVVAPLDLDEVQEIFDMRMVIEEHAGHLATTRRTIRDVAEVDAIYRSMAGMTAGSSKEIAEFSRLNRAFHERLFVSTGRNRLRSLLGTLQANAERFTQMGARLVSNLAFAHREHLLILEAFRAGDADMVAKHSRDHVYQVGQRLLDILKKHAQQPDAPRSTRA
jgi:DNA-binding GntR family transcriptional regulator